MPAWGRTGLFGSEAPGVPNELGRPDPYAQESLMFVLRLNTPSGGNASPSDQTPGV